jgi:hypothetical protein
MGKVYLLKDKQTDFGWALKILEPKTEIDKR